MNLEQLASTLEADPDYKVLRRLKPRIDLAPAPDHPLAKGVVIDTETTGLDADTCKIIEVGLVAFEYDPVSGQPIRVLGTYGGLEDPGHPLSEEITELTGITDAMVVGQRIDDELVKSLVANANIVIAHNANFDRPFLENRLPVFATLPWGCSFADIDWTAEKLGSRKLDYIAYQMGFFFGAHRAEEDCQALLEILARPLPVSGRPGLKSLLDRLPEVGYTVYAINSPFSSKDALKARQYRWDAEGKVWHRTLAGEQAFDEEITWLKATVYGGRNVKIEVEERDARSRFSGQSTPRSIKLI
jgi:DNA polymerase-3 subunit epsilon